MTKKKPASYRPAPFTVPVDAVADTEPPAEKVTATELEPAQLSEPFGPAQTPELTPAQVEFAREVEKRRRKSGCP